MTPLALGVAPDDVVVTDGRVAAVSFSGVSTPYRMQLVELETGRRSSIVSLPEYQLRLGREQRSVFHYRTTRPTMVGAFRTQFDPGSLAWGAGRTMPEREPGDPTAPPYAFTPEGDVALTEFGAFQNQPGGPDDLRRLGSWQQYGPTCVIARGGQTNFLVLGTRHGMQLLRRDRWEVVHGWALPDAGASTADQVAGIGDTAYAVVRGSDGESVSLMRWRPPWEQIQVDTAPVVAIEAAPSSPTTADTVVLDASSTADDFTPGSRLVFRWDADGDGGFDTEFRSSPYLTNRFPVAGARSVTVQVQDEAGNRASATLGFGVVAVPVAASRTWSGMGSVAWTLGFSPGALLFDGERGRLFVFDPAGQRLVEVSLTDGLAKRSWPVGVGYNGSGVPLGAIRGLSISPDGRRIIAVETRYRISDSTFPTGSALVEYRLGDEAGDPGARFSEIEAPEYPNGVLQTLDGWIASAADSEVRLRDWPGGRTVGRSSIGTRPVALVTAPVGGTLYFSQDLDSETMAGRIRYDGVTGQITNSLPRVRVPGYGLAPLGAGRWMISGGYRVLGSDPLSDADLRTVTHVAAHPANLILDLAAAGLAGFRGDGYWDFWRTGAWTRLATQAAPLFSRSPLLGVGQSGGEIFEILAVSGAEGSMIRRVPVPSTDPASNRPPTLRWEPPVDRVVSPGSYVLVSPFPADADGEVRRLDLLVDGVVYPRVTGFFTPEGADFNYYRFWFSTNPGPYSLQIEVEDNLGAVTRSAAVEFRINRPPVIGSLSVPTNRLASPASFVVETSASDDDPEDGVAQVVLRIGGRELGRKTSPPWRFEVQDLVGLNGQAEVTVQDRFGGSATRSQGLRLDPIPGQIIAVPVPVAGDSFTLRSGNRTSPREQRFNLSDRYFLMGRWWSWVAPTNLVVEVDTVGSSFDTLLEVLRVDPDPQVVPTTRVLALNNDAPLIQPWSRVKFHAVAGTEYRFGVGDGRASETGDIVLNLRSFPRDLPSPGTRPVNDHHTNAAVLVPGAVASGTTRGATFQNLPSRAETLPTPTRSEPFYWGTNSVWYRFAAPAGGWARVEVVASGSEFDPVVRIFRPWTNFDGPSIAGDDDAFPGTTTAVATFPVTGGSNYLVQVTGAASIGGDFNIRLDVPVASPFPEVATNTGELQARPLEGDLVREFGTTGGLPAEGGRLWWRWTARVSGRAWWWLGDASAWLVGPFGPLTRQAWRLGADGVRRPVPIIDSFSPGSVPPRPDPARGSFLAEAGSTYLLSLGVATNAVPAGFSFTLVSGAAVADIRLEPPVPDTEGWSIGVDTRYPRWIRALESEDLKQWRPLPAIPPGAARLEVRRGWTNVPAFFLRAEALE